MSVCLERKSDHQLGPAGRRLAWAKLYNGDDEDFDFNLMILPMIGDTGRTTMIMIDHNDDFVKMIIKKMILL